MRDLVIMPAMAQRRESLNMGEFAEEAIIVEEVAAPKRVNHFIEANTQEVTLQHLQQDCIIPSFASMDGQFLQVQPCPGYCLHRARCCGPP